jgi:hypothetical protein
MATVDSTVPAPLSEEELTTTLLRKLVDVEAQRWREMRDFSRRNTGHLIDRVLARIDALLRRV